MTTTAETPRPSIEELVLAEQARLIFDRSRLSNLLKVPFALLVCWLMRDQTPHAVLACWVTALFLSTTWRALIDARFAAVGPAATAVWLRRFQWAVAVDGLVFGMIGFLGYRDPAGALSLIMVTSLIAAEAIGFVVFYMHLKTMLLHVLAALVPVLVWQFCQGTQEGLFIGIGGAFFISLIVSEGLGAQRHTRDMLRLRFQMDELAAQRAHALSLAERHSALKGRVLATMSHEIRTPLHGVLGITRMLDVALRRGEVGSGLAHVQTMKQTGEHLLTVINDVLDYSSIEKQRIQLNLRDFDLAESAQEAATLTRGAASGKGLAISLEMNFGTPCRVRGDPARLRQILLNLTGNAVKFTSEGSVVIRVAREPSGKTEIAVVDTGTGIAASDQEVIFEAFQQADRSFGRRHGGTGLGLTIARELARAMGGDLTCQSAPGQGSTFLLTLPLPPAQTAFENPQVNPVVGFKPVEQTEKTALSSAHVRNTENRLAQVLLVDDNRLNAYVAERMLEDMGLQVVCADSGADAIELAAKQSFDLILMDCQMPMVDGFEATRRIRELEQTRGIRPVPIIAVTANALEVDRQRSLAAGMNDHLAKPFGQAELAAVVRKMLRSDG